MYTPILFLSPHFDLHTNSKWYVYLTHIQELLQKFELIENFNLEQGNSWLNSFIYENSYDNVNTVV